MEIFEHVHGGVWRGEQEDGKENDISCLGFFVLIVNKKTRCDPQEHTVQCLIPHCCTNLCESPPQQLILEFSADSFFSWLYRMSSVTCLNQDF